MRLNLRSLVSKLTDRSSNQMHRKVETRQAGTQSAEEHRNDVAAAQEVNAATTEFVRLERRLAKHVVDWIRDHIDPESLPEVTDDAVSDLHEHLAMAFRAFQIFDDEYYLEKYASLLTDEDRADPIGHYFAVGRERGYDPNPHMSFEGYITRYPDIAGGALDPFLHFLWYGFAEGRETCGPFDGAYYLEKYPDVAAAGLNPLLHFLKWGQAEGRLPNAASEQPQSYLDENDAAISSGTIIFVSHDANVGGAQNVLQSIASWTDRSTAYQVKIVTMGTGGLLHEFMEIGPTLDMGMIAPEARRQRLKDFAGDNVKAVFLNSISSGEFISYWDEDTPILSYLHELPKVLKGHLPTLELVKQRASMIIAGSGAVATALHDEFDVPQSKVRTVHGFVDAAKTLVTATDKAELKRAIGVDPKTSLVVGCGVVHWRKSPNVFIDTASRVLGATRKQKVEFIWVGGGPDLEMCEEIVRSVGWEDRIRFTGYEADVTPIISAADVFLLPSEEDPFPLVCLIAAQAMAPIICFEDAGGMPELVNRGCGRVVPFHDAGAMADATLAYIKDEKTRLEHGAMGQALVRDTHTIATTGPLLFSYIREAANLAPKVSVVVPNFNHCDYLTERLESINNQTFQDFEVILLDDKSTDASVVLLNDWAETHLNTVVIANEENSGSPFKQWRKGMAQARGELIWMAESDDYCEPELLERMLPAIHDCNTFLAYCKSVPVGADGVVLGDYEDLYLNRINEGRWAHGYVDTDHDEASASLGIANCIPNASSVIYRNFVVRDDHAAMLDSMKMCGDWLFYLLAIQGGQIAYVPEVKNFHRRHGGTVTARTEGSVRYFSELATIQQYVRETYDLTPQAEEKSMQFLVQDLDRFNITDVEMRDRFTGLLSEPREKTLPTILFVAPDLSPGGGQMFIIRLANAWMRRGGRAFILNVGHFADHEKVLNRIEPRVGVFSGVGQDEDYLNDLCASLDVDIIHSSIWWADKYVLHHLDETRDVRWVNSMHGCHETILGAPGVDPEFRDDFTRMLGRIDEWVHTADKNIAVFGELGKPEHESRIRNGVPIERRDTLTREGLGLREDAIALCLASRAIESKGWFAAVSAVQTLNEQGLDVDLMLIGEGEAADQIAATAPPHVHLYGQVDNLHDYLDVCDIGILPSFFVGESLPLVLLETIALAKPVIATDVGEIASIIGEGDKAGGILTPLKDGVVDQDALVEAIRKLATNADLRAKMGAAAEARHAAHYSEAEMVNAYEAVYRRALARAAG